MIERGLLDGKVHFKRVGRSPVAHHGDRMPKADRGKVSSSSGARDCRSVEFEPRCPFRHEGIFMNAHERKLTTVSWNRHVLSLHCSLSARMRSERMTSQERL